VRTLLGVQKRFSYTVEFCPLGCVAVAAELHTLCEFPGAAGLYIPFEFPVEVGLYPLSEFPEAADLYIPFEFPEETDL
jgi:hypothetical protein